MARAAASRHVWLVGRGDLVGQFADHGLLAEILVGIAPVTLGGGAPLLPRRLTAAELELVDVLATSSPRDSATASESTPTRPEFGVHRGTLDQTTSQLERCP